MADNENLPFHRKYRPNTLIKYVGNDKLKETAMKALQSGKRPQVILLYGDSGCGKTSFARLLAKEYSCLDRDDLSGACGVCMNCQAIDDYITTGKTDTVFNIQEINIADQSGKRDLDAVLADMEIPAFGDEWKIYILDECHEASSALQNKLLKIAEEPPEQVLIIFCTTNPEKMIETLKNRCQLQLKVTKPSVKELSGLLRYVCENEQVEYDQKGLEFIATRAELTIRTSLQNLWQVVVEQNSAKYEAVTKVFDEISSTLIINFFKALKGRDVFRYITLLYDIKSKMELKSFMTELREFVKRGVFTINGIKQDGVSDAELVVYRDLFGDMGVAEIGALLTKLVNLNVNNLEMELMMLGYTGLTMSSNSQEDSVFDKQIEAIEGELAKEVDIMNKVVKEKADASYAQGVDNAKKQMQNASIDLLMSMGGTLVE